MTKSIGGLLLLAAGLLPGHTALAQPYVCMDTNIGEFCLELFSDAAPNTVANFLGYVEDGDFDGTVIHRSEPELIIQGGGYYLNPLGTPVVEDTTIANEFSLPNTRGTIAMAKLGGDPDSGTNQWFINLGNNAGLNVTDGGYTVFGEVVSGMHIVDIIGNSPRVDLRAYEALFAFGQAPILRAMRQGELLELEDFFEIRRVYTTDIAPIPALTSFEGGSLIFPVRVGGLLYLATMRLTGTAADPTFRVDRSDLVPIVDAEIEAAEYSAADKTLVIPSVRTGNRLITNVTLQLTDLENLEFRLIGFE